MANAASGARWDMYGSFSGTALAWLRAHAKRLSPEQIGASLTVRPDGLIILKEPANV
jgi:hypothetical protein